MLSGELSVNIPSVRSRRNVDSKAMHKPVETHSPQPTEHSLRRATFGDLFKIGRQIAAIY